MSLLTNTEKVLKSELYINKKYIRQRLTFDLRCFVYSTLKSNASQNKKPDNSPTMTIDLRNFHLNQFGKQSSWQSFNILDSIKSYLLARNSNAKMNSKSSKSVYYTLDSDQSQNEYIKKNGDELVLIMEARSLSKNRRSSKSLSDTLNPYLIIYSTEKEDEMRQFFQNRISAQLYESITNKSLAENSIEHLSSNDEELQRLKGFEDQVDKLNELDDDDDSVEVMRNAYQNARKSEQIKSDKNNKTEHLANYIIQNSKLHEAKNSHYYDFLAKTDRIIYKNYPVKRSLNETVNDLFDESKFLMEESKKSEMSDENICSKQTILIDFNDMSFSDWILEPKSYQSNYCAGTCKFPLNKVKI